MSMRFGIHSSAVCPGPFFVGDPNPRKSAIDSPTPHNGETGELETIVSRAENLTYMPYYDWAKAQLLWKDVSLSFKEK